MTFKELLIRTKKEDIIEYLREKYEYKEKTLTAFEDMFSKLYEIEPVLKDNFKLFVANQKDILGNPYISVLAYNDNEHQTYAITFTAWAEWLSMEVIDKSVEFFGEVSFVSECMNEMSFISFSEDEIQKEAESLEELSEGIKNGTVKTYTFDEVKQMLREEFDDLDSEYKEDNRPVETEEEIRSRLKEIDEYNKANIECFLM